MNNEYFHYAVLVAIYLLLGGFEQILKMKEGFTDYSQPGNVPLMVRNATAPVNFNYDTGKLDIANMDGNS